MSDLSRLPDRPPNPQPPAEASSLQQPPAQPTVAHLHRAPSPTVLDVDGTAALAPTSYLPTEQSPQRPVALRVVPPLPSSPADAPPPPPVTLVLRGLLEVLSGWRPVAQLVPLTSPEIAADLLTRRRPRVAGRPPAVANLRTLRVSSEVVEACAVVRRERRCGALAMRFEYGERGWLLTRLEVG